MLKSLPSNSVDSIVTDPPYELGFMGKAWDATGISNDKSMWSECLRVLKPGGHILAFSGSRTYHRMVCAIEDAGFEVRDQMMWVYSNGFPKNYNVSKALDKDAGAKRDVIGQVKRTGKEKGCYGAMKGNNILTAPATDEAKTWDGWGTALKPAHEPICVARKPLDGTVAQNVLKWGVGGLNVDGCRVEGGRWPANFLHDGSDEIIELMPVAARFFYCARASKKDRDDGCDHLETKEKSTHMRKNNGTGDSSMGHGFPPTQRKNTHPTVKPCELMRYLCRLITPKGGTVLDPFNGSGSTGKAALLEGMAYIGVEMSDEYITISKARLDAVSRGLTNEGDAAKDGKDVQ